MRKVISVAVLIFCLVTASCSSGTYLTPYTPSTSPATSTYLPPQTTTAKPPTTSANAEKDAILTFTLQALEIEAKRDALVNCYAGLIESGGWYMFNWIIPKTFLDGVTPANPFSLAGVPPTGLEGMTSLRQKMILLSCPQSM